MNLSYRLTAVAAAVLLFVPAAHAENASVPLPTLGNALSAFGQYTIPASWAGVWNTQDSDFDCDTNKPLGSDADTDTLCTGEVIDPGAEISCTGSTSDTNIDIDCSGTFEIIEGCSVTMEYSFHGTRNGDTANVTTVFSQEFSPTMCAFLPDDCTRTETVATRIGPEPPGCLTPVLPATWGQLKAVYR